MDVICDIETDDLNPKYVWVIVCREVETNEVHIFPRPDLNPTDFLEFSKKVDRWIGHNFIPFDYYTVMKKFFSTAIPDPAKIVDTLVCSRLFNYDIEGGHSLDAWAQRLGLKKPKIEDFSAGLSDEMIHRCVEDTAINLAYYNKFKAHINGNRYRRALKLEHDVCLLCCTMTQTGFPFDADGAKRMLEEIEGKLAVLDEKIKADFPPQIETYVFVPKVTRKDLGYTKGIPIIREIKIPFNPASPKQLTKVLHEAGWQPLEKTKGHIKLERELKHCKDKERRKQILERLEDYKIYGYSVSEENLETLPADAPNGARLLAERITLASRQRTLVEWLQAYNARTGNIHGTFLHIGSWTGRMAHRAPNMANIPKKPTPKDKTKPTPVELIKLDYNMKMRALWRVKKGYRLIGVDAEGIQLRILAHYMNDKEFTNALVSGDKELGTDAHTLNAIKLGFDASYRDRAKTFIYAWLLGAGTEKVSEILKVGHAEAKRAVDNFIEGYPGLRELKARQIPNDAKRGYFEGIDGRLVPVPNEHKVLAGYLQNGEAVIMKEAFTKWNYTLTREGVPFWMCDFVHDEWQTMTIDDDDVSKYIARVQMNSIKEAGETFNLNCPLAGSADFGYNWAQTH